MSRIGCLDSLNVWTGEENYGFRYDYFSDSDEKKHYASLVTSSVNDLQEKLREYVGDRITETGERPNIIVNGRPFFDLGRSWILKKLSYFINSTFERSEIIRLVRKSLDSSSKR